MRKEFSNAESRNALGAVPRKTTDIADDEFDVRQSKLNQGLRRDIGQAINSWRIIDWIIVRSGDCPWVSEVERISDIQDGIMNSRLRL